MEKFVSNALSSITTSLGASHDMPELTIPRPHLHTVARRIAGLSVAGLLALTGCTAGTMTAGSTASGSSLPGTSATQSSATASGSSSGVAVDPCQVVTQSEVSTLAGTTFSAGEEQDANGSKACVYTANGHAFQVLVTQAASPADAQSQWSTYEAQATSAIGQLPSGSPTPSVTPINGLGDRAESATLSISLAGQTLTGNALFVLKGAVFLALSDLSIGSPAASATALQTQAKTSLDRLP